MKVNDVSSENVNDVKSEQAKDVSPEPQSPEKRKRGRRRKNGLQSSEIFVRAFFALDYFNELRRKGMKYEAALHETADQFKCSPAEIKRIRAKYQAHNAKVGLGSGAPQGLSEADMQRNKAMGLPEVFWNNPVVTPVIIGPIPIYPRHNARKKA